MFELIEVAPADPILGLNEAFQKDPNPAKINLSVGVYKDADGVTPVMPSVKAAEERLLTKETTKSYLGIGGLPEYDRQVQCLMFGQDHSIVTESRAVTTQTPGGTGALRVAGDFIHRQLPKASIWLSKPTWANHPKIFQAAEVPVKEYAYLDAAGRNLEFNAMLAGLQNIPAGDVVLLHGCCHNPSGVDPDAEQWRQIAQCVAERKLVPLLDFAYQGFGRGLNDDATGLRIMAEHADEMLIASSFSKNFGLYRERVGALTAVAKDAVAAAAVLSQLKLCIRANYSNPPAHGGAIVETILTDVELRSQWEAELAEMRDRINDMRRLFVDTMRQMAPQTDLSFLCDQQGMFSFSGLTPQQVDRLREESSIYIVRSGRINVAGITAMNVKSLCQAVANVL